VPEIYLKQVQVGQSLAVALDAIPGKTFDGKVFALNPLFDAAGRAIVIRAVVRNTETALRRECSRACGCSRARRRTRWSFPTLRSCLPATSSTFTGSSTARRRRAKVEIGQRREGLVEILEGLEAPTRSSPRAAQDP